MNKTPNVLIIDDDSDFANFIYDVATGMNLDCTVTTNSDDFMNAYNAETTLIFLDLIIPGTDGIELLRFLGKQACESGIILMSGVDKRVLEVAQDFASSIGLSVVERIQKPVRLVELEDILHKTINAAPISVSTHADVSQTSFNFTRQELEHGIKQGEFVMHYQPKVEIATNILSGVEALVRWQHPEHGLILPDEFISLVEKYGLIDDLGWLVIEKGLDEIGKLKQNLNIAVTISLNLSPYSLHDLTFPDKFIDIVKKCEVLPESIILEITETGLVEKISSALDIFTRLRMKQISLSIDDFGTGYAMMQQLKHIPAMEIKIDKSFVEDMLTKDSSRVTVLKIIEIGHDLGMQVLAEGVETQEQLEFLRAKHCDLAQGYIFSKPLTVTELTDWIKTSGLNVHTPETLPGSG